MLLSAFPFLNYAQKTFFANSAEGFKVCAMADCCNVYRLEMLSTNLKDNNRQNLTIYLFTLIQFKLSLIVWVRLHFLMFVKEVSLLLVVVLLILQYII